MKISFIGTGYVGLVSGVMMSHIGHDVVCIDIDESKVNKLRLGNSPIFEPGLDKYISKYGNSDRLKFICRFDETIKGSDCLFITVGTPPRENGDADLSGVFACIESAAPYIPAKCIIVMKSTVPPGTCLRVSDFLRSKGLNNPVVSNPEFLREGEAIKDFLEPDRIVIGADNEEAFAVMRRVYELLTSKGIELIETDLNTSELIKYASNTFLANKIAFINEMADLCEIIGADISKLAYGIGLDKRIGSAFFKAGPGFGGSCFPKDILALKQVSKKINSEFLILDAVISANNNRTQKMLNKITNAIGGDIENKRLAVLGLTYKAGTDDLRSSPAIGLINQLHKRRADIVAYDPEGMKNASRYFDNLRCASSMYEAIENSDAIIIITEWREFQELDLVKAKHIVNQPVIIDLRNIMDSKYAQDCGFKYHSVGRNGGK
ncbi:MAG: UDP-glucose/GDP-mannose dehydrogenase family protein [Rickettsiaceae bacterium]